MILPPLGLVIIPCGKAKLAHPASAAQLYVGSFFRAGLAWARSVASEERIRILSARHGLLPLDQQIAPYDQQFGVGPVTITVDQLRRQAALQGLADATPVVAAVGAAYLRVVREVWPEAQDFGADQPHRGIGYRMGYYKAMRGRLVA